MSAEIRAGDAVETGNEQYVLRLYVAGSTFQSSRAITNLKMICEAHLKNRYVLTVVDLYERRQCAHEDHIQVSPTLVRVLPLPERRLVGGLSDSERVMTALDLATAPPLQ